MRLLFDVLASSNIVPSGIIIYSYEGTRMNWNNLPLFFECDASLFGCWYLKQGFESTYCVIRVVLWVAWSYEACLWCVCVCSKWLGVRQRIPERVSGTRATMAKVMCSGVWTQLVARLIEKEGGGGINILTTGTSSYSFTLISNLRFTKLDGRIERHTINSRSFLQLVSEQVNGFFSLYLSRFSF